MIRIAFITGSTRPGRRGSMVADWALEAARRHPDVITGDVEVEPVDLAHFDLPVLNESTPAMFGVYEHDHTRQWADCIAGFDGFVFVTAEYNHSIPGALKNAIDYLFAEWNDKAAGFVSYGVHGGTRAVEHLRQVLAELKVAGVRSQVALSTFTDFVITDPTEVGRMSPGDHQEPTLAEMLDELFDWSRALANLRARHLSDHAAGDAVVHS